MDLPKPVVLVLAVTPSGRIAITRDSRFPPKRWGLVAGYIEREERPEQAALRELLEETGLTGTDARLVGGDHHDDNVMFCVRCTIPEVAPTAEPGTEVELAEPVLERIVPNSPAWRVVARYLEGGE